MDTLVARKNYKCSILYITGLLYTTLGDGQACHPINSQGWLRRGRLMYGKSGLRQRYLQGLSPWMEVNFPEYGFCRGCGPKPGVWVGNFHRPSLCEKRTPHACSAGNFSGGFWEISLLECSHLCP